MKYINSRDEILIGQRHHKNNMSSTLTHDGFVVAIVRETGLCKRVVVYWLKV